MDEKQLHQGEINLMDLLFYCLEKWRWIVTFMLVVGIALGVYKYQATVKANQLVPQPGQENEEESSIENVEEEQSINTYERAIEQLERDLEIKENYLENSVVMQMEPNHITTGTLSYYVEDGEYKSGILAAYNAFVSGGTLAEELFKIDQSVPVEDLQYLISFSNSKTNSFSFDNSNQTMFSLEAGVPVFQVQIRMPNSELGELYLKYTEESIGKYTSRLQSEIEEYKIILLSSTQSEMADTELQEYQSTMRTAYAASVKNLQALRTEFDTFLSTQGVASSGEESRYVVDPMSSALGFVIPGLILGAGLVCLVLIIMYWMGGKLKNIEGFHIEYGMPLLGVVRSSSMKKKLFGFIDDWIFQLRGGIYSKITFEEQMKMTVVNVQTIISKVSSEGRLKRVMLAGTIGEKDAEELCARLAMEIKEISFSPYRQIVYHSSALKELESYDGILFLEKNGVSNSELISQEKKLASDRDVKVLGTIIMC